MEYELVDENEGYDSEADNEDFPSQSKRLLEDVYYTHDDALPIRLSKRHQSDTT